MENLKEYANLSGEMLSISVRTLLGRQGILKKMCAYVLIKMARIPGMRRYLSGVDEVLTDDQRQLSRRLVRLSECQYLSFVTKMEYLQAKGEAPIRVVRDGELVNFPIVCALPPEASDKLV